MRLSRTVEYALHATLQIASSGTGAPISARELASCNSMPARFLLQVLHRLVMSGILRSTRGVHGGYKLQRPCEDVSLLNLIEAVDGPVTACVPGHQILSGDIQEMLGETLNDAAEAKRIELHKLTIVRLLRSPNALIATPWNPPL